MATSIEKVTNKAPELVSGRQIAQEILENVGLKDHDAQVALCLDISGTMYNHYVSGRIQKLAERLLAFASLLDDNAHIDVFLFGDRTYYAGEMNLDNVGDFIRKVHKQYTSVGGTYFGKAIRYIRNFYFPFEGKEARHTLVASHLPAYVMMVTDGTTLDENDTVQQLIWGSHEPIFWQFMALGKSKEEYKGVWGWLNRPFAEDFSFLKQLDVMGQRNIDNVNFFNLEHPLSVDERKLYELMLVEYPEWLKIAKKQGMVKE